VPVPWIDGEHHVVAFAVPAAGDVVDLEQQADHLPGPGRLERDVVVGAVQVDSAVQLHVRARSHRDGRALLPPLRVEAERVPGRRSVVGLVVDVIPERRQRAAERAVTAMLQRDPRAGRERHREVGMQPVRRAEARVDGHQRAPQQPDAAVRHAEEIAKRDLDGGSGLAVPVTAQDRVAVVSQLRERERTVDVHDAPGAVVLEQRDGFPGLHDEEVPVAAAAVPRRGAPAACAGVGEEAAQGMLVERM